MTRFFKDNPQKRWECDACFTVYKGYYLGKKGGTCPDCGCECFTEYDKSESTWKKEEKT